MWETLFILFLCGFITAINVNMSRKNRDRNNRVGRPNMNNMRSFNIHKYINGKQL